MTFIDVNLAIDTFPAISAAAGVATTAIVTCGAIQTRIWRTFVYRRLSACCWQTAARQQRKEIEILHHGPLISQLVEIFLQMKNIRHSEISMMAEQRSRLITFWQDHIIETHHATLVCDHTKNLMLYVYVYAKRNIIKLQSALPSPQKPVILFFENKTERTVVPTFWYSHNPYAPDSEANYYVF